MNNLLDILVKEESLKVNKWLAHLIGIKEAILLIELINKYEKYLNENVELVDGYFPYSVEDLKFETTLSKYQQIRAIKKLTKLGWIESKTIGMPAKRCFKILDIKL